MLRVRQLRLWHKLLRRRHPTQRAGGRGRLDDREGVRDLGRQGAGGRSDSVRRRLDAQL